MSTSRTPFNRADAGTRAAARHRVRVATALAAGGALLGSGILTIALLPTTHVAGASASAFGERNDDAPASLTGTTSGSTGLTGGSGPAVTTSGGS